VAEPGETFEEIYNRYFHAVFLFLKQLSKDEQVAEELTSETFFKAMRSIDAFRGQCDTRVWLCQIAKNCYLSYLKKRRRVVEMDELEKFDFPDSRAGPEEQASKHSEAMRAHRFLHELAEPYKEVFTLRVFGELSFQQIGSIFQKTENWACVTYHRARKKLMEQMEADHG